jgi:hypothetical protein
MQHTSTHNYQPLAEENRRIDNKIPFRSHSKPSKKRWRDIVPCFVVAGTIVLSLMIIAVLRSQHNPPWQSCGENTESANERGCSFDQISFAWQTPECFDAPLVAEFAAWEDWTFYTESGGNTTIPRSEALLGKRTLYVSWRYHMVHCTFIWKQMHRAYERGWIDSHIHDYNHTLHCGRILLEKGHMDDEVITEGLILYPVCARVGKVHGSRWWN